MRVIICGAPASGKGTQCETIVEKVRHSSSDAKSPPDHSSAGRVCLND